MIVTDAVNAGSVDHVCARHTMMHIRPGVRLTLAGRAPSARWRRFSASGLLFKKVHDREPIDSVRVTLEYRVVGLLENDGITWF